MNQYKNYTGYLYLDFQIVTSDNLEIQIYNQYSFYLVLFQGSHLSKFAFKTETTGSVNVKLNVILQSR